MNDDWTFYALAPWVSGLQEAGERAKMPVYAWISPFPEDFLDQAPYPVNAFLQHLQGGILFQALSSFWKLLVASWQGLLFWDELDIDSKLLRIFPRVYLMAKAPYEHVIAPLWGGPLGDRIRIGARWNPDPPGSPPAFLPLRPPIWGHLQIFLHPYREGGQEGFPFFVWIRAAREHWALRSLLVESIVVGHFRFLFEMASDYYATRMDLLEQAILQAIFGDADEDEPTGDLQPLHRTIPVGYGVRASAWDLFQKTVQRLERALDVAASLARGDHGMSPLISRLIRHASTLISLMRASLNGEQGSKEALDEWLQRILDFRRPEM